MYLYNKKKCDALLLLHEQWQWLGLISSSSSSLLLLLLLLLSSSSSFAFASLSVSKCECVWREGISIGNDVLLCEWGVACEYKKDLSYYITAFLNCLKARKEGREGGRETTHPGIRRWLYHVVRAHNKNNQNNNNTIKWPALFRYYDYALLFFKANGAWSRFCFSFLAPSFRM
jgi:hypothetical protein